MCARPISNCSMSARRQKLRKAILAATTGQGNDCDVMEPPDSPHGTDTPSGPTVTASVSASAVGSSLTYNNSNSSTKNSSSSSNNSVVASPSVHNSISSYSNINSNSNTSKSGDSNADAEKIMRKKFMEIFTGSSKSENRCHRKKKSVSESQNLKTSSSSLTTTCGFSCASAAATAEATNMSNTTCTDLAITNKGVTTDTTTTTDINDCKGCHKTSNTSNENEFNSKEMVEKCGTMSVFLNDTCSESRTPRALIDIEKETNLYQEYSCKTTETKLEPCPKSPCISSAECVITRGKYCNDANLVYITQQCSPATSNTKDEIDSSKLDDVKQPQNSASKSNTVSCLQPPSESCPGLSYSQGLSDRIEQARLQCRVMRSDIMTMSDKCDVLFSQLQTLRAKLTSVPFKRRVEVKGASASGVGKTFVADGVGVTSNSVSGVVGVTSDSVSDVGVTSASVSENVLVMSVSVSGGGGVTSDSVSGVAVTSDSVSDDVCMALGSTDNVRATSGSLSGDASVTAASIEEIAGTSSAVDSNVKLTIPTGNTDNVEIIPAQTHKDLIVKAPPTCNKVEKTSTPKDRNSKETSHETRPLECPIVKDGSAMDPLSGLLSKDNKHISQIPHTTRMLERMEEELSARLDEITQYIITEQESEELCQQSDKTISQSVSIGEVAAGHIEHLDNKGSQICSSFETLAHDKQRSDKTSRKNETAEMNIECSLLAETVGMSQTDKNKKDVSALFSVDAGEYISCTNEQDDQRFTQIVQELEIAHLQETCNPLFPEVVAEPQSIEEKTCFVQTKPPETNVHSQKSCSHSLPETNSEPDNDEQRKNCHVFVQSAEMPPKISTDCSLVPNTAKAHIENCQVLIQRNKMPLISYSCLQGSEVSPKSSAICFIEADTGEEKSDNCQQSTQAYEIPQTYYSNSQVCIPRKEVPLTSCSPSPSMDCSTETDSVEEKIDCPRPTHATEVPQNSYSNLQICILSRYVPPTSCSPSPLMDCSTETDNSEKKINNCRQSVQATEVLQTSYSHSHMKRDVPPTSCLPSPSVDCATETDSVEEQIDNCCTFIQTAEISSTSYSNSQVLVKSTEVPPNVLSTLQSMDNSSIKPDKAEEKSNNCHAFMQTVNVPSTALPPSPSMDCSKEKDRGRGLEEISFIPSPLMLTPPPSDESCSKHGQAPDQRKGAMAEEATNTPVWFDNGHMTPTTPVLYTWSFFSEGHTPAIEALTFLESFAESGGLESSALAAFQKCLQHSDPKSLQNSSQKLCLESVGKVKLSVTNQTYVQNDHRSVQFSVMPNSPPLNNNSSSHDSVPSTTRSVCYRKDTEKDNIPKSTQTACANSLSDDDSDLDCDELTDDSDCNWKDYYTESEYPSSQSLCPQTVFPLELPNIVCFEDSAVICQEGIIEKFQSIRGNMNSTCTAANLQDKKEESGIETACNCLCNPHKMLHMQKSESQTDVMELNGREHDNDKCPDPFEQTDKHTTGESFCELEIKTSTKEKDPLDTKPDDIKVNQDIDACNQKTFKQSYDRLQDQLLSNANTEHSSVPVTQSQVRNWSVFQRRRRVSHPPNTRPIPVRMYNTLEGISCDFNFLRNGQSQSLHYLTSSDPNNNVASSRHEATFTSGLQIPCPSHGGELSQPQFVQNHLEEPCLSEVPSSSACNCQSMCSVCSYHTSPSRQHATDLWRGNPCDAADQSGRRIVTLKELKTRILQVSQMKKIQLKMIAKQCAGAHTDGTLDVSVDKLNPESADKENICLKTSVCNATAQTPRPTTTGSDVIPFPGQSKKLSEITYTVTSTQNRRVLSCIAEEEQNETSSGDMYSLEKQVKPVSCTTTDTERGVNAMLSQRKQVKPVSRTTTDTERGANAMLSQTANFKPSKVKLDCSLSNKNISSVAQEQSKIAQEVCSESLGNEENLTPHNSMNVKTSTKSSKQEGCQDNPVNLSFDTNLHTVQTLPAAVDTPCRMLTSTPLVPCQKTRRRTGDSGVCEFFGPNQSVEHSCIIDTTENSEVMPNFANIIELHDDIETTNNVLTDNVVRTDITSPVLSQIASGVDAKRNSTATFKTDPGTHKNISNKIETPGESLNAEGEQLSARGVYSEDVCYSTHVTENKNVRSNPKTFVIEFPSQDHEGLVNPACLEHHGMDTFICSKSLSDTNFQTHSFRCNHPKDVQVQTATNEKNVINSFDDSHDQCSESVASADSSDSITEDIDVPLETKPRPMPLLPTPPSRRPPISFLAGGQALPCPHCLNHVLQVPAHPPLHSPQWESGAVPSVSDFHAHAAAGCEVFTCPLPNVHARGASAYFLPAHADTPGNPFSQGFDVWSGAMLNHWPPSQKPPLDPRVFWARCYNGPASFCSHHGGPPRPHLPSKIASSAHTRSKKTYGSGPFKRFHGKFHGKNRKSVKTSPESHRPKSRTASTKDALKPVTSILHEKTRYIKKTLSEHHKPRPLCHKRITKASCFKCSRDYLSKTENKQDFER